MAKKNKNKLNNKLWSGIWRVFASPSFFWIILVLFALQMLWIAFSAIYPMLFDEEYHLGIIEIYSRQLSPFLSSQPAEAAFHGDITRLGSYLFHYTMSLPFWVISHFTDDIVKQVIILRIICIAFVLGGVVMWRKVLQRLNISPAMSHIVIAAFTFIPLVPFALSQLNYDSLAFLLVPLIFYLAIRSVEKGKRQVLWFITLLSVSALACLVKFTILPIATASVVFVLIATWRRHNKKVVQVWHHQLKNAPRTVLIAIGALLLLSSGLFIERYGMNLVQYRTIEPKCNQVHSREVCMNYTVYRRDTTWREANVGKPRDSALQYTTGYWAPHIFNDFFVTGAFIYEKEQPLEIRHLPITMQASAGNVVLRSAGWVMLVVSVIAILFSAKYLWRQHRQLVVLTGLVLGIYMVSLWLRNYTDYLKIGAGTAAQGRYFIPLLIPVLAVAGLAINHMLRRFELKLTFIIISVLLFTQGGGVANYILYSNDKWYWPAQRQVISDTNKNTRNFLRIFIRF